MSNCPCCDENKLMERIQKHKEKLIKKCPARKRRRLARLHKAWFESLNEDDTKKLEIINKNRSYFDKYPQADINIGVKCPYDCRSNFGEVCQEGVQFKKELHSPYYRDKIDGIMNDAWIVDFKKTTSI